MNRFILFFLMMSLLGFTKAIPVSEGGILNKESDAHVVDGYYDMLALPKDFNYAAYPCLNTSYLMELVAKDPNAKLPTLPDEIVEKYKVEAQATSTATDVLKCETSQTSPPAHFVNKNGLYLLSIGSAWCCANKKYSVCTRMAINAKAATDICAAQGICVRCSWAGNANKQIADKCENLNFRAGGYVR